MAETYTEAAQWREAERDLVKHLATFEMARPADDLPGDGGDMAALRGFIAEAKALCNDSAECPDCPDPEDFGLLEAYGGANIWAAHHILAALQAIHAIAYATPASFRAVIPEVVRDQVAAAILADEGRELNPDGEGRD